MASAATEQKTDSEAPRDSSERLHRTLSRYDAGLLRQVANGLLRLRTPKPPEELIERMAEAVHNAAAIDRRLRELDPAAQALLSLISQSGLLSWPLGGLLELLKIGR